MIAEGTQAVLLGGSLTWTPGAGVNLPQTNASEFMSIHRFRVTGPANFDSTAKASGNTLFNIYESQFNLAFTIAARPGPLLDIMNIYDSDTNQLNVTTASGTINMFSSRITGAAFVGITTGGTFNAFATRIEASATFTETAIVLFEGVFVGNNVTMQGNGIIGAQFELNNSNIEGSLTVQPASVGSAFHTTYFGGLSGGGSTDRTITTITFPGPSSAAPAVNVVSLAVFPYNIANYVVTYSQTLGTATPIIITSKAVNQFVFSDPVGGNSFDFSLQQIP